MKLLKSLRVVLAVVSFLAIIAVFVDFTGMAAHRFAWLPKVQLVPALLALNFVAIAVLIGLTFIFGRIYCSVICPLGIYQDIVNRLRVATTPKKKRRPGVFRFQKAATHMRTGFLVLFAVLLILGLTGVIATSIAGILDPYSAFGRIAGQILVPIWHSGMSSLADTAAEHGHYPFEAYPTAIALNAGVLAVAVVTLIITTAMAWTGGRAYCNKVCPVGTLLGFISRHSLLRITINTELCNHCGSCGRHCKARCIDSRNQTIDFSRCVACFDCIGHCSQGALSYSLRRRKPSGEATIGKEQPDTGRRAFMAGAAIAGGTIALRAADKVTDGGLTPLKKKQPVEGAAPTVPAGSLSLAHITGNCTSCQLCISRCPDNVLRPSDSFGRFMQPVMTFTDGYCRPECTLCSDICPAGAIRPVTVEQKAVIKIGNAVVTPDICISAALGEHCGSCARHCPAGAIRMVKMENGHRRPTVDENLCIGCGSCEYHCPVGATETTGASTAAIHVEGIKVHREL